MDTLHSITRLAKSRWSWFLKCWTLRSEVLWLLGEHQHHRDELHLRKIENERLEELIKKLSEDHQQAKDGNRALLRFIHARHRLNMRLDSDSIRSALRAADERKDEKKP